MRLADLLADVETDELDRLAHEHARAGEHLSRPQLLDAIASDVRSYRFLQDFLVNRHPPAFAMLLLLLDAPGFSLPVDGFRAAVLAESERITDAVAAKRILRRDDQLRVYRRVLYQAWSNDDRIDGSEAAILSVLRSELEITPAEHFLLGHHSDMREFAAQEGAFPRELGALRSAGLVFVRDGQTLLPDDLVPSVRLVLGLDMSRPSATRLFGCLTIPELHLALESIEAPTSGSKGEKIERLMEHLAQPKAIFRSRAVTLERLREISKDVGAKSSGAKEELADRIIAHVAADRDLKGEPEPPPRTQEERGMDEAGFQRLFLSLRGTELVSILGEFDLRRSGSKEALVKALWDAHRSTATLLDALGSGDLEEILRRQHEKTAGSKADRIARLIGRHLADGGSPAPHPAGDEGERIVDQP